LSPWAAEHGLVILIGAGYAALGEIVLWRFSSKLREWVESFLVGGAVAASLLFLLTLTFPPAALRILGGILAACIVIAAARRIAGRGRGTPRGQATASAPPRDAVTWLLFALALFSAAAFLTANARTSLQWDGFQIWASRAQVLFHRGSLVPELPENDPINGIFRYPALVPLTEALLAQLRGSFDFEAVKPVFLLFYLAMAIAAFEAARAVAGMRAAAGATAVLLLLPLVSGGPAAGGYADIPQAAFVAGALSAFLAEEGPPGWRSPAAWVIGGLSTVKQEGTVLALLCLAAAGLSLLLSRRRDSSVQFVPRLSFFVPPALFLGLRVAYLRWVSIADPVYGPLDGAHLLRALARIPEVALHCGRALFDWSQWGLLWAAFAAALLVLALDRGGSPRARASAAVAAAALLADSAIFLFTNWEPAAHIGQAYPRLLSQLAPAAVVVVAAAYGRLGGAAAERPESRPRAGHAKSRTTVASAARDTAPPAARPGGRYRNLTSAVPAGTCTARNA
jgi:hypothetical protein